MNAASKILVALDTDTAEKALRLAEQVAGEVAGFKVGLEMDSSAGFGLYDFSNIKFRYGPNDYVIATVALYLDFLNLFWFLVQILLSLSGGGSSRRN